MSDDEFLVISLWRASMDTLPAHWVWPPLEAPEMRRDGKMTKRKLMALFKRSFRFNLNVTPIADLLKLVTSMVSTQVNTMLTAIKEEERINPAWKVSRLVSRKIDAIAEEEEAEDEEEDEEEE